MSIVSVPDVINGAFECSGGFFVLLSVIKMLKDKKVAGVSILTVLFFTSWGLWNLYYYPYLNQIVSFLGGVFVVIANFAWLYLVIKYRSRNK